MLAQLTGGENFNITSPPVLQAVSVPPTTESSLPSGCLVLRPARVPSASRFLNPYVVGFVVVAGVVILAVTIALLIHFLAFDQKSYFYHSSFQILNVKYSNQLNSPATQEYRDLSGRIESMITKTFQESNLRNQFIRAHVVKLRQEGNGVIADVVMKFKFTRNNNGASMKRRIESVLHHMLNNSGNLEINPSTEITCNYTKCYDIEMLSYLSVNHHCTKPTKMSPQPLQILPSLPPDSQFIPLQLKTITDQDTVDMFTQGCGARTDLITLSAERILGGTKAEEGDWPWQVSLQTNNVHHCGGILISSMWILTAAHCFRSYPNPRQWTVTFGVSTTFPKQRRGVRTILIHSNYNPATHENDIAAIQLDRGIAFTKDIHRVCLPEATQNIPPGSTAYVTGWGSQEYGGSTVSDLQQARVRIISNDACNAPTSYNGAVLSGMLCAGLPQGGVDACRGDSGGPLVQEDSRRLWFLVGIVSWGDQCGLPDKPGVYTRVTAYRAWITEKTGV
ncbi:transmembrane protease serine 11D [Leopardus geoffroyi]|uniref:transmembrane protease serine 11D n=1 Tax=Leopardus geoffroyi TaxID=46844 RepID=UPI001E265CED|nr:transmembrane protease serine 11D [Leopardus geoffroyi]